MKTVQTELPEQLYAQLRSLVVLGRFQDKGDVLREADAANVWSIEEIVRLLL